MGNVIARFGGSPASSYSAEFVSYSGNSGSVVTEVVVTPPAGIADGDMLAAFLFSEAQQSTATCTGFTQVDLVRVDSLHEARSFYKVASSESGNYTWTVSTETSGLVVHMYLLRKTGGTWTAPSTAGYHAAAGDTSTGVSTGNITTQNNSVLVCGFSHDNIPTVTTPPSDMTQGGYTEVGTMRGASYYQEISSGSTLTKNIVWSISDRNAALGMVFYAN